MAARSITAAWHDRVRGALHLNPGSRISVPCRPPLPAHQLKQVLRHAAHVEPGLYLLHKPKTQNPNPKPSAAQLIRTLMDAALAAGLNTLRMWSHGVTSTFSSQPSPGVFAEPMFRGLDYALEQARLRNLKARPARLARYLASENEAWT